MGWWVTILGFVGDHPRVCGPRGLGRGPQGLGKGCTHVSSSRLDFTSVHFLLAGDYPWWVTILRLVATGVWKGVYQLSLNKFFDPSTPSMRKGCNGEEKTDENSGHYVIASSRPPEQHRLNDTARMMTTGVPHARANTSWAGFCGSKARWLGL